jgi:hypothetical protein
VKLQQKRFKTTAYHPNPTKEERGEGKREKKQRKWSRQQNAKNREMDHLKRQEFVVVLCGDQHELNDVLDVWLQVVVAHLEQHHESLAHLKGDKSERTSRRQEKMIERDEDNVDKETKGDTQRKMKRKEAHLLADLFAGVVGEAEERLHVVVHVGGQRGGHEEQEVIDGGQRVLAHQLCGVRTEGDEGGDHGVERTSKRIRVQRLERRRG